VGAKSAPALYVDHAGARGFRREHCSPEARTRRYDADVVIFNDHYKVAVVDSQGGAAEIPDVFVSYSRRDIEVVSRLCDGLKSRGKTVFIDVGERLERPGVTGRESVAAGVAAARAEALARDHASERERAEITGISPSTLWMDEIRAAIAGADNVVVVISPDSCASAVCREELDYALELNKRLVPVVVRETPADLVPPAVRGINWLPVSAGPSFDTDIDRLAEVLDTDVDGLHLHTRLTVRAREWYGGDQDKSLLLRGQELSRAERWLGAQTARKPRPTSAQTSFILASRAAATRRQRGSLAIGTALLVVMAGLTSLAGVEWHSAVIQRDVANSRAWSAESGDELAADPQLALLLALRAYQSSPTTQAETAVRQATGASTVRGYLGVPPSADGDITCPSNASGPGAFDRSGQYAVITCAGYVEVWRWASKLGPGSAVSPYVLNAGGSPAGAIFDWTGNAVQFIGSGNRIYQWDWRTSSHVQSLGDTLANSVLFPTPAGTLVAGENGHKIAITNLSSGLPSAIQVPCCTFAEGLSPAIAFSPDGTEVATLTLPKSSSQQGIVSVFDVSSGATIFTKTVPEATWPLALSPDGQIAVAVGASAEVFSLTQPAQAPVVHDLVSPSGLPAHCCDVDLPLAMTWTPNGDALAVGSEDQWMRVWLGTSSSPIYLDDSNASGTGGIAFSPNGQYLLTSGGAASQVWQWAAATPLVAPSRGTVEGMAVSPSGQIFAAAESDNSILLWNWQTNQLRTLAITDDHAKSGTSGSVLLAFSPNGDDLISAGPDDYVRFWSVSAGTRTSETQLPGQPVSIAFSPSGNYLGVAYVGGVARWDIKTASSPVIVPQPDVYDGGQILSLGNTGVMEMLTLPGPNFTSVNGELIDIAPGSDRAIPILRDIPMPGSDTAGTLLPDHRLLLCSETCWLYAIGVHSLQPLKVSDIVTDAGEFSLTGDQNILYTASDDGGVSAWDLKQSDQPVLVTNAAGAAPKIQAGANSNYLLIGYNSTIELIPTAQDGPFADVLKLARSEVVRSLTAAEQEQYLGSAEN
jgi:WD40 repeat protein